MEFKEKNNDQTFRKHPKCSVAKSSFPKQKDKHLQKQQIAVWPINENLTTPSIYVYIYIYDTNNICVYITQSIYVYVYTQTYKCCDDSCKPHCN